MTSPLCVWQAWRTEKARLLQLLRSTQEELEARAEALADCQAQLADGLITQVRSHGHSWSMGVTWLNVGLYREKTFQLPVLLGNEFCGPSPGIASCPTFADAVSACRRRRGPALLP